MKFTFILLYCLFNSIPSRSYESDSCPVNTFQCESMIDIEPPIEMYSADYGEEDYAENSYEYYSQGGDTSGKVTDAKMNCLPESRKCDGKQDCFDCSDEKNCSKTTMFWCGGEGYEQCYPLSSHCDNVVDCPGGTDECGCEGTIRCNSSSEINKAICVPQSKICDQKQDCYSYEDESNCGFFVCPDTTLIAPSKLCDGTNDCKDTKRSDECNCSFTFMCGSGECIHNDSVCDGTGDCTDGSDECECSNPPNGHFFRCHGSRKCIAPHKVCNDDLDCDSYLVSASNESNRTHYVMDCSDETVGNCSTYFLCHSAISALSSGIVDQNLITCVSQRYKCNGRSQCDDGSDECGCEDSVACPSSGFDTSSKKCLLRENFCDATPDCDEQSDERRTGFGMKCLVQSSSFGDAPCLLPQSMIDDGVTDCSDQSDVCYRHGNWRCFLCFDRSFLISTYQVCDGVIDCPDLSDECACFTNHTSPLCPKVCGMSDDDDCVLGTLQCEVPGRNGSVKSEVPFSNVCNGKPDCVSDVLDAHATSQDVEIDENYCSKRKQRGEKIKCPRVGIASRLKPLNAVRCDGRPECSGFDDECDQLNPCVPTPKFCENISDSVDIRLRGEKRFRCPGGILPSSNLDDFGLPGAMVCDGKVDCAGRGEDELPSMCTHRYPCNTVNGMVSIDEKQKCDGRIDCNDNSDELECDEYFYCENGDPLFVDKSVRFDGVDDCTDMSDECPKNQLEGTLASSREMIASPVLRTTVWITAVISMMGNLAVIIYQIVVFCCRRRHSAGNQDVAMSNRVMILNLAVADLLTGLYLFILALQSVRFSGTYCHFDKVWRTSSWCSNLGLLNSIATEASVVIVVMMTTYRLCAVYLPFETSTTGPWKIAGYCCCGWLFAVLLTIIPRIDSLSNYFIGQAWLPLPFFDSDIVKKDDLVEFARRYYVLTKNESIFPGSGWSEVEAFLQNISSHFNLTTFARFGYYSKHSVCIPNMLAAPSDPAVGYSIAITTLNLIALLYIVVAYIFVYKGAVESEKSRTESISRQYAKGESYPLTHPSSRQLNGDKTSHRTDSVKAAASQASIMQARIFRLVASNVACWLPLSVMAILKLSGVELSNDAYAYAAIILLPIISTLNPILYSNFVPVLWKKMTNCRKKASSSTDVFISERSPLSGSVRTTNV